jgi:hypothetical protein
LRDFLKKIPQPLICFFSALEPLATNTEFCGGEYLAIIATRWGFSNFQVEGKTRENPSTKSARKKSTQD